MTPDLVRQLSAIMFADIVGYTALMQRSEAEAVERRDRFRGVLAASVEGHGGEAVQHYGDGTLAVFPSAVEAAACALEIQREMRTDPQVPLRIGLHLGDIVRDAEGVYGDGVNVAARIQALAVPGSVLLTDRVAEQVKNHSGVPLAGLGQHRLKNVQRPVAVFAISDDGVVVPGPTDIQPTAPTERSVAVLPFVNMSSDAEKEFFSDGITEEIINALAQLAGLKVTSRTSSFAFKGSDRDIREIAKTLDVSHVLEGSVRSAGNRVRVTAQLIDARSGFHLFSKTWDRDMEDVFLIQDEISVAIAVHLEKAFGGTDGTAPVTGPAPAVERFAHHSPAAKPEAYELYLQARHHWNSWSPEGALRSLELYGKAIEIDPDLALAHAGVASSYTFLAAIGRLSTTEAYGAARAAADRALEIDPESAEAEVALALGALFYEWNRERAERHFERALELSPGSATVHHFLGMHYTILGRYSLAIAALRTAVDLDPLSPPINNDLARALAAAGQPEEALAQIEHALKIAPSFRTAMESKAMILWTLGDADGALAALHEYRAHAPGPFAGAALLGFLLARSGDMAGALEQHQRLEERERLEPGTSLDADFAILYLGMRKYEWALNRLEKAVDSRAGGVVFLGPSNPIWGELDDHPRFKALQDRIGLWG